MDIRHNGQFYRTSKTTASDIVNDEPELKLESAPDSGSSKILVSAYKNLVQHFNQLDQSSQNNWQLEINIIARQLAHMLKQNMNKKGLYSTGHPLLNLLKEIQQLDKKIKNKQTNATVII